MTARTWFADGVHGRHVLAGLVGFFGVMLLATALYVALPVAPWSPWGVATDAVLLGTLMLNGKSLPLCIGMHVGFNAAAVWTGIRLWDAPLPLVEIPPALLAPVGVLVALAYWHALRART